MDSERNNYAKDNFYLKLLCTIGLMLIGLWLPANAAFAGNGRVPIKEPPVVVSHTPDDDAVQVPVDGLISVVWDRPMHPDTDFTVTGPEGFIPGTFLYVQDSFTVTFLPENDLAADTRYGVLVAGQVDMNGVMQRETYQWNFSTVTPTSVSIVSFGPTNQEPGFGWWWSSWPWLMAAISVLSLAGFLFVWNHRRLTAASETVEGRTIDG